VAQEDKTTLTQPHSEIGLPLYGIKGRKTLLAPPHISQYHTTARGEGPHHLAVAAWCLLARISFCKWKQTQSA